MKSTPSVLYYHGQFYTDKMRKERVTKEEIMAAARQNGIENIEKVRAVFLETDGSLSVIKQES